jgi:putative transposase
MERATQRGGRGPLLGLVGPCAYFVERLWRSVKYEDIYIWCYETVAELRRGLGRYFEFYNEERPHQSLAGRTPGAVYREVGATRA